MSGIGVRSATNRLRRPTTMVGVVALLAASCAEPDPAGSAPSPTDTEDVPSEPPPDPTRDTLIETLTDVDGLRALAWTLLATGAEHPTVTPDAAARASARLPVVLVGLELLETSEVTADPADDGAVGAVDRSSDGAVAETDRTVGVDP